MIRENQINHLDVARDVQIGIYKNMSPAQKWRILHEMIETARRLKRAGIRHFHPDWDSEAVEAELRRIWIRAVT
ncbi:MAG: hypothetical protein V1913_07215 [Fibrobacterota bacterium]